MDFQSILKAAKRFEKQAQTVYAQPTDIQSVLEKANLWNTQKMVSPMLNQAHVPDDASVNISILTNAGPKVDFNVVLEPNNPRASTALAALLKQKFAAPMAMALKNANLNIENLMVVNWLKF